MARGKQLALTIFVLTFLLAPSRVDACSCGVSTLCETYWQASAVFSGEVLEIAPIKTSVPGYARPQTTRLRVRFRVDQWYRGKAAAETEVQTGVGAGDCGFKFVPGEKYLVFARNHEGRLATSICSPTKQLAGAAAILAQIKDPHPLNRVFGQAVFDAQPKRAVAANTDVRLRGPSGDRTLTTNAGGYYEFTDVPPGRYTIELMAPRGWLGGQAREIDLAEARGCAIEDFRLATDGRVHLKAANTAIDPAKPLTLELIDADKPIVPGFTPVAIARSEANGDVTWRQVPPGRYLIGLNVTHEPDPDRPYPPTFYPGVPDRSAAKVIEVALGAHVTLPPFPIPERRRTLPIRGTVVRTDSRPVAGEGVSLISAEPHSNGQGIATERTDKNGRFTFTGVEGMRYRVRRYLEKGITVDSEPFELTPATAPILLVMRSQK